MSVSIARLVGAAATAFTVAVAGAQQQPAASSTASSSTAMKDTTKMASKSTTKRRAHRARTASKARHDSATAAHAAAPKPR